MSAAIWTVILAVGIGTYLMRLSFLALIGGRTIPDWAMRLLRYVPVAVLPALFAPLVVWPAATGGAVEPARLAAAGVALAVGIVFRSVLGAIAGGMGTLYLVLWLTGP
jgi:branched-subunit amino acid transport protein